MNKISETVNLLKPIANINKPRSDSSNRGKIRKDLTSFALLSDAFLALNELEVALRLKQKIAADLLVRYILEVETDFYYLFKVKKGKQNFCDAYINYGNLHQAKVIKEGDIAKAEAEWLDSLGIKKVKNKNHWSGLNRSDLMKAVNSTRDYSNVLYKIFSGFSHPGIFTLERTLEDLSLIYTGYSELNATFPAYTVADMFSFAAQNGLYGVNYNQKAISRLEQFLDGEIKNLSKTPRR